MPPFDFANFFFFFLVGGCLFLRMLIISQVAAKEKLPSRLLLLPAVELRIEFL